MLRKCSKIVKVQEINKLVLINLKIKVIKEINQNKIIMK
jgi:hypothetical protein